MNHLTEVKELKNQYYICRHAQSQANVEHLIVAAPEHAVEGYGLSPTGIEQCKNANAAKENKLLLFSSDFKRAYETAQYIAEKISNPPVKIKKTTVLRERSFGKYYELQDDSKYGEVWGADACRSALAECETPSHVAERVTRFIIDLEKSYSGHVIVFFSHGDVLQITQTAFLLMDPNEHRSLKHLENAEIRRMALRK